MAEARGEGGGGGAGSGGRGGGGGIWMRRDGPAHAGSGAAEGVERRRGWGVGDILLGGRGGWAVEAPLPCFASLLPCSSPALGYISDSIALPPAPPKRSIAAAAGRGRSNEGGEDDCFESWIGLCGEGRGGCNVVREKTTDAVDASREEWEGVGVSMR